MSPVSLTNRGKASREPATWWWLTVSFWRYCQSVVSCPEPVEGYQGAGSSVSALSGVGSVRVIKRERERAARLFLAIVRGRAGRRMIVGSVTSASWRRKGGVDTLWGGEKLAG